MWGWGWGTLKLCSGNRLQWDTLECAVSVWLFVAGTTLKNFKVMKLRIPRIAWFLCAMKKQDGYFPGKQGIHLLMRVNIITNIFIKYPKRHKISHIYITMNCFLKKYKLPEAWKFWGVYGSSRWTQKEEIPENTC